MPGERLTLGTVSEHRSTVGAARCPEPLCPQQSLPAAARHHVSCRRALPRRRRSYGLMRQTIALPPPSALAPVDGSLPVVASPGWAMVLPDVIPRVLPWMPGPLPRRSVGCMCPLLPQRHRPSLRHERSASREIPLSDFRAGVFSQLQPFANVQASKFACHPGRSYRDGPFRPPGSCGVFVRAKHASLPSRASDVLAGRVGRWRAGGRVRWQIHGFRRGPQSGSHDHVSRPPLRFRASGFPQHGSKASLSDRACPRAPAVKLLPASAPASRGLPRPFAQPRVPDPLVLPGI